MQNLHYTKISCYILYGSSQAQIHMGMIMDINTYHLLGVYHAGQIGTIVVNIHCRYTASSSGSLHITCNIERAYSQAVPFQVNAKDGSILFCFNIQTVTYLGQQ